MNLRIIVLLALVFNLNSFSQRQCDYSENFSDSTGVFKSTKEFLVFERIFGQNEQYLYVNLNNEDGVPYLTLQYIQKNNQFIKAHCFGANSKFYLQLENGKIVTLVHINQETCGNYVSQPEGKNVRVLTGNFLFLKNNLEDLKNSSVSMMRIKFGVDSMNFVIKDELESEALNKFFRPSSYFIEYLHCVLD